MNIYRASDSYDLRPLRCTAAGASELWDSPPFEPVLKNGYVFARGSTDNKGQNSLRTFSGIQETIEEHRELPVNLHLVIEGEEEIGSANLGPFLSQNRDALKCDVAVVSDTGMITRGVPTMSYGLRGVTALEVKVTGPKMDLTLRRFWRGSRKPDHRIGPNARNTSRSRRSRGDCRVL